MNTLYIVVPVLNEAGNVKRFFSDLHNIKREYKSRYDVQIILVDDGSTDDTVQLARDASGELALTVLQHPQNMGPGYAFGTAFEHLAPLLKDGDWVLTMEGDNTSRSETLQQMFRRSEEGFEVLLASPYLYGGGVTNTNTYRVLLSKMANTFVKEILGLDGIVTVSSFYRLYRAEAIRKLQACYGKRIIERRGFECMIELLMKMVYLKMTISEIAMVLDTSRRVGKSKMKVFRTIRGYLTLIIHMNRWKKQAQQA